MLTERQKKIVRIIKSRDGGVTGSELAGLVGVSSKTIRTDIKALEGELAGLAEVVSSTRSGYQLRVIDEAGLQEIVEPAGELTESRTRSRYILRRLLKALLTGEPLKQQELADSLYIGLSTLKENMREVKEELAPYELKVENYKNQGMLLAGTELAIRQAIYELFLSRIRREELAEIAARIDGRAIRELLIRVTSAYDMVLTDNSLNRVLGYTVITLLRAEAGHSPMYRLQATKAIEREREFAVASAIFEEIYKLTGLDVMTSEIYYLAQHLIACKRYSRAPRESLASYVHELTAAMLARVEQLVGLDLRADTQLIEGLEAHIQTVIPRIRFGLGIQNDILTVVKNEYPLAFQIGVIASKVIEERENLRVSEEEIGFLAVHFGAALLRTHAERVSVRRALIVCGSGTGTAVLLKARLAEKLRGELEVVGVCAGYQLAEYDVSAVDIIISTISAEALPELPPAISARLVVVRHFLDTQDLSAIRTQLGSQRQVSSASVEKFFRRECFLTGRFSDRDSVLRHITSHMERLGLLDERAAASVFEREVASPTELGNLVAIPHPMENATAVSSIGVMVLERPIMWHEHHVQVVFLISIAKEEFYLWEPIFLKLFDYFVRGSGIRSLIAQPDYDKFITAFKQSF